MISAAARNLVIARAQGVCEYCHALQHLEPLFGYQVEHVRPKLHGGTDELTNLAFACPSCNAHKGPNLTGIDEKTGKVAALFNPRRQRWNSHFMLRKGEVFGLTAIGRASVRTLKMNKPERVGLRA